MNFPPLIAGSICFRVAARMGILKVYSDIEKRSYRVKDRLVFPRKLSLAQHYPLSASAPAKATLSIIADKSQRGKENIWWSHHVQWFSHLAGRLRSAPCQPRVSWSSFLGKFSWQVLRGKSVDGKFYFMLFPSLHASPSIISRKPFRIDHSGADWCVHSERFEQLKYWPRPLAAGLFQQLCSKLSLIRIRWRFRGDWKCCEIYSTKVLIEKKTFTSVKF